MAVLGNSCQSVERTVWCKPRSKHWWDAVNSGVFGDDWWKENLRMSRDTFTIVCSELRPYIEKQVVFIWIYIRKCMHFAQNPNAGYSLENTC